MATQQGKGLAEWIEKTVFAAWKENRDQLEATWQRNWNAYKRINEGAWKDGEGEDWRSKTFVAATKQKIVAAVAIIADQVLQGGKLPFAVEPSAMARDRLSMADDAEQEEVRIAMEAMQGRIEEQLEACDSDRQYMRCVLSGAIYGETTAKRRIQTFARRGYQVVPETESQNPTTARWERVEMEQDAPAWEHVSVWDIYHDLESDDLQTGEGVIHRQYMSPFHLLQLADQPHYDEEAIREAIRIANRRTDSTADRGEEDDTATLTPGLRNLSHRRRTIRVLEFWGRIPARLATAYEAAMQRPADEDVDGGVDGQDEVFDDGEWVEVAVTVAASTVIRYARNETGRRPFYRALWEEDLDDVGGISVADNTADSQKLLNGAVRAYEDNVRLAGDVMLAIKPRFLLGEVKLKPGGTIPLAEECQDARQAVQQIVIQNVGDTLLNAINLAQQFADDDSNIPRVQQGQSGDSSETAFELGQRLEKSGKYLAQVIKNYDNGLVDPLVSDLLDYNMADPGFMEGKGDFKAVATGFSSFQHRLTQLEGLNQLMQIALAHEAILQRINIDEVLSLFAKLLDQDPDQVLMPRPQEGEAPAPDPAEQAAQAAADAQVDELRAKAEGHRAKAEVDQQRLRLEQAKAVAELERLQREDAAKADQEAEKASGAADGAFSMA